MLRPPHAPSSQQCLEAGAADATGGRKGARHRGFVSRGDPGGEHQLHQRDFGAEGVGCGQRQGLV